MAYRAPTSGTGVEGNSRDFMFNLQSSSQGPVSLLKDGSGLVPGPDSPVSDAIPASRPNNPSRDVPYRSTSDCCSSTQGPDSPPSTSRGALRQQASLTRTLSKLGGTLQHYASLVVAESPVEAHRTFLERQREDEERLILAEGRRTQDEEVLSQSDDLEGQQMDAETRRSIAVQRWQGAIRTLMSSARMVRDAETIANRLAHPADRFAAVVELEMRLSGNPHKLFLMTALEKKRLNRFDSFFDHLLNELFITGERIFEFFTPAQLGCHKRIFTLSWLFVSFVIFAFMIGAYPFWILQTAHSPGVDTCVQQNWNTTAAFGPPSMLHWMAPGKAQWCWDSHPWALEADFLITWGARFGPLMKREPHRWFTSWFLHQNFMHVLSNMLLFSAVALVVEEKYGCWRIMLLWFLSALGGNFFSAAFENSCIAVVGASGGVFGMFGLFIADMVMNFESIKRPILQTILMVAFLVFFIVTVATTPLGTSHLSHIGGFICGLFPSFLFLPNLRFEKWEAWLPIVGSAVTILVYVGLPCYYYFKVFPGIGDCGTTLGH